MKRLAKSGVVRFLAWASAIAAFAAARAPADDAARLARAEAMKATLEGINSDLQKYGGGDWKKWGEANKAYREAASALLTPAIKWPWPAKHTFAFQGSAIKLLMEDTLDGRRAHAGPRGPAHRPTAGICRTDLWRRPGQDQEPDRRQTRGHLGADRAHADGQVAGGGPWPTDPTPGLPR
jgi:hypothetical protein